MGLINLIKKIGKGLPLDLARVPGVAKVSDSKCVKILTPKIILERLPIALAQIKAANTSWKLLNEIR